MNALVELKDVNVAYGNKTVLSNVSFNLESGKIVTLIGPNGAGKSTLVRVVLGLLQPVSGQVIRQPDLRIGYVPQRLHIDGSIPITVKRFLQLAGKPSEKEIYSVLDEVGAIHVALQSLHKISGGEFQRVLLARALLRNPQLMVLDEPVAGVDLMGQNALYKLISELRTRRGCAVLLVSHDLHLVMASTDEVVCLNQHVCCHGHPEDVSQDPAFIALFGSSFASNFKLYTHHHDHHHSLDGHVISDCDHSH
ncbi:MAG TPA: zinc ABC transporter ATP-binding protein ZnuC [Pseudomonadales bacterium]|nr:zinc ABC transporter ATP-binding protein ZnuC [Pseudomonadales bacterium]